VRDSSLSACTQAVIAAEVGQLDLAYDYLGEAALMDLMDLQHNTRTGLHIGSLAGAWTALVAGFAGMRAQNGELRFAPRLPPQIGQLAVRLRYRGRRLKVTVTPDTATYELLEGDSLLVWDYGEKVALVDEPISRPIPPVRSGPRPAQPQGRQPQTRLAPS
jgi:alpha,alpha-trehalose phosphorylase